MGSLAGTWAVIGPKPSQSRQDLGLESVGNKGGISKIRSTVGIYHA
ncbi:MAG TPA: hypothetical protein VHQ22_07845 [Terriglobales bacterium]|nr:hypothetical protein [Terriglobales bacterium]